MLASLQSQYVVPPKNRLYRKAEAGTVFSITLLLQKGVFLYPPFCITFFAYIYKAVVH